MVDINDSNGSPGSGAEDANGNGQPFETTSRPAVAAAPGKTMLLLGAAAVVIAIIVKSLFFSNSAYTPPPKDKGHETVVAVAPPQPPPVAVGTIAVAPPNPTDNKSLVLPPPPPVPPTLNTQKGPNDEALKQRIKSPMVISGGGGLASALGGKKTTKPTFAGNDPNAIWSQAVEPSHAETAEATRIPNLNITIAQGKMIHGVLETAIDTDLPGMLRAVVSHDIYAEAGREILVPKGSRIIGQYNPSVRHGTARVFIIWTRIIRPDGVDIQIDSPGTDALGRAGLGGDVDNKYFEMFSTAILTSTLDIGVAAAGQGLFGNQQQTTTQGSGGVTTTSSPTSTAMQQAVANVGTVGNSIVNSTINLQPTINVDQGTQINIFVNKDLVFPGRVTGQQRIIE